MLDASITPQTDEEEKLCVVETEPMQQGTIDLLQEKQREREEIAGKIVDLISGTIRNAVRTEERENPFHA